MKITIKTFSLLRAYIGTGVIEVEIESPVSMKELIDLACKKINIDFKEKILDSGQIRKGTLLLVEGKNVVHQEGLDTMIPDNSLVSIFPPSGGG